MKEEEEKNKYPLNTFILSTKKIQSDYNEQRNREIIMENFAETTRTSGMACAEKFTQGKRGSSPEIRTCLWVKARKLPFCSG